MQFSDNHAEAIKQLRHHQGDHRAADPATLGEAATNVLRSLSGKVLTPEQVEHRAKMVEQARQLEQVRTEVRARESHAAAVQAAGLPERHVRNMATARADAGPWSTLYADLRERIGHGLLLAFLGSRGPGKTQLAVCLADDALRRGKTVRYAKALDLFRELRACFRDSGPDEVKAFKTWTGYELLIIDEAHQRAHSDFQADALTNIIDARYDALRDTIIISNDTREDFAEAMGPSIMSRLSETGEVIEFDWPSFRDAENRRTA